MDGAKQFVQESQLKAGFKSMLLNFPYSELSFIRSNQIKEIRQCLPFLLEMSQTELFYANQKAVQNTLNFATSMILEFNNINDSDLLVDLLLLLDNLLNGLKEYEHVLNGIYPNVKSVLEILLYVTDLEIFSTYFASICEPILLNLLLSKHYEWEKIDVSLTEVLENFKNVRADKEVQVISDYIFKTFPLDSTAFSASAVWLLESTEVLKKVQTNHIGDETAVKHVVKNIYKIFMKVGNSVRLHSQMLKYEKILTEFKKNLMHLTPKLIMLCCTHSIGNDARQLLDLVLDDFLNRQGIMARDIEHTAYKELQNFPNDVTLWPTKFSKTFLWLTHLLYYNQRVVWSTTQIANAIRKLIYTKMYRKAICPAVLKSVCYIFPIMLRGATQHRITKMQHLGEDLLNLLSTYRPLLDKILSLSKYQLIWILHMAPPNVKIGCVKFWLTRSSEDQLCELQDAVHSANCEKYLIGAALSAKNLNTENLKRLIDSVTDLKSQVIYKELPCLITKHLNNKEAVKILVQTCSRGVPSNITLAIKLYQYIKISLIFYRTDEILLTCCYYISNVLNFYKSDEKIQMLICSDMFWFRFPVSKIKKANAELLKAILKLLNVIVKYQPKRWTPKETVPVKLSILLNKSEDIIEETLIFMQELSNSSPVILDGDDVVNILEILSDLADDPLFAPMVYRSLVSLLKMHSDLINCPLMAMLIEERCYYLEYQRRNRLEYVKLFLLYIKILRNSPSKDFCYLPHLYIIRSFIIRAVELKEDTTNRYLTHLNKIYRHEKDDSINKLSFSFKNVIHV